MYVQHRSNVNDVRKVQSYIFQAEAFRDKSLEIYNESNFSPEVNTILAKLDDFDWSLTHQYFFN